MASLSPATHLARYIAMEGEAWFVFILEVLKPGFWLGVEIFFQNVDFETWLLLVSWGVE